MDLRGVLNAIRHMARSAATVSGMFESNQLTNHLPSTLTLQAE
jgi:hypothetical protein